MDVNELIVARYHARKHRDEILSIEICGCFFCLEKFKSDEIKLLIDNQQCAMCPKCGIDSVIGSSYGYQITDDFLFDIHNHWFQL